MVEDRILILRFQRGSGDALRRIYEKYKNDLLKLAISLAGDVATAEDVVQDVFVSFAQAGRRIRPAGDLRKYLVTCVANGVRNRRRHRRRHPTSGIEDAAWVPCDDRGPERWAVLNEELRQLSRAMAQVPYEQREVVSLYMDGDLTFRKIAAIQNVSINTVQGRYRYGLTKLRSLLNGELNHEAGE
jgi:RNA polymerase sigma-70 factor (ECF subfamily)